MFYSLNWTLQILANQISTEKMSGILNTYVAEIGGRSQKEV